MVAFVVEIGLGFRVTKIPESTKLDINALALVHACREWAS